MDENDILDMQEPLEPTPLPKPAPAPVPEAPKEALQNQAIPPNALVAKMSSKAAITEEQSRVLSAFMDKAVLGHQSALAMKCKGLRCHMLDICPLHKAHITLPINESCPVEEALMQEWVTRTLTALNIDPSLPENAVDVNMVFELAGMEVIRWRTSWHLHNDAILVEERIVGYSPQGEPIYDEKPKMALLISERYAKVVGKLREQLLATRRSQAQVGKVSNDVSVRGANMVAKAKEIAKKRREKSVPIDADFEVKNGESDTTSSEE
jgi:hypothetical protein